MKIEIGKKYTVCVPHIAGVCDTCSTYDVQDEETRKSVQAYADSDRATVIEGGIEDINQHKEE